MVRWVSITPESFRFDTTPQQRKKKQHISDELRMDYCFAVHAAMTGMAQTAWIKGDVNGIVIV